MHPMTARAIVIHMLTPEQKQQAYKIENELPKGRYLVAGELSRIFSLKTSPVLLEETMRIDRIYYGWERDILWPKNAQEEKNHEENCSDMKGQPWCRCRTRQQEIQEWDAWSFQNMEMPKGFLPVNEKERADLA
jgi:hypothetical protein